MTPALIKCLIDYFIFIFSCSSPTSSSRMILEEFIEKTWIFSWSANVSCFIAQAVQVKYRQALKPIVQILQLWCGLVHLQGWQSHFCNQNWHLPVPLCHPTLVSRCWGTRKGWTQCASKLCCTSAARGIHSLRKRTSLLSALTKQRFGEQKVHPPHIDFNFTDTSRKDCKLKWAAFKDHYYVLKFFLLLLLADLTAYKSPGSAKDCSTIMFLPRCLVSPYPLGILGLTSQWKEKKVE